MSPAPHAPLRVHIRDGSPTGTRLEFTKAFRIGRTEQCEVCVKNDFVNWVHAEVQFEDSQWVVRDLNSGIGLYLDGERVEHVPVARATSLRLGIEGPELVFEPQSFSVQPADGRLHLSPGVTILRRYLDHYFRPSADSAPAGERTMYVRRVFAKVWQQPGRRYARTIAGVVLLALCAAGIAVYERIELRHERALAEDLFYAMKSIDVDVARLERVIAKSGSHKGVETIREYENRRREMQSNYDQYLAALNIYNSMTEEQRIMLRVARIFGECELKMPPDFEAEVNRYIGYWRQSDRLASAIRSAQQNGYVDVISKELLAQGLPPQFFYLALEESNFNAYAVGPATRKGIAKGMWQFIPQTAINYGLRVGPLADLRRLDPGDERDQFPKATQAAVRYLKDLYSTDGEASGFLVMACYNWGQTQMFLLMRNLPASPRERNFWRLLSRHRNQIPHETYDYVFHIVSAAVIGENPRLFGFDFDNPLANRRLADDLSQPR